jgi:predicted dinucleotide-utilizing enzyme
MIFLIEYDRPKGRIVTFATFKDTERHNAETTRLNLELDLNRKGVNHEVVLLEAASEEAVRRTHRRYFEDVRTIVTSATAGNQ